MNVLIKLEALVFLGTSYGICHPLFVTQTDCWVTVYRIYEELEPNKCIVRGQIGTYVLFNTNYVKYITHFNESSFTKYIKHFSLQY